LEAAFKELFREGFWDARDSSGPGSDSQHSIHGFTLLASGAGSVMRDSSASLLDRGVHDICYYLDVRRPTDI